MRGRYVRADGVAKTTRELRKYMTGNKHNREGERGEHGEPAPGPYWQRMHRDWRFWVCAFFMAAALAIYVLSGDLAWIPRG